MPNPTVLFAALLALIFLAPENSRGQPVQAGGQSRNPAFDAYYDSLVIPFSREVFADMKLNDAQKAALWKMQSLEVSRTNWKDRTKRKYDVIKLLTTEQRNRLDELTLQYQGALVSLNLPDIAAMLNLTLDQKQRLATIEFLQQSGTKNLNDYEKILNGPAVKGGRFLAQLKRSCDCLAESVLVPAQIMKWRGMQGKPLTPRPAEWD